MSAICYNSHKDKTFWKYIHLLKTCFDRGGLNKILHRTSLFRQNLWLFPMKSVLPEIWLVSNDRAINQISIRKVKCEMFWWERFNGLQAVYGYTLIFLYYVLNREMINYTVVLNCSKFSQNISQNFYVKTLVKHH